MDPLSVAASVAGVAATGVQLSHAMYDLISTFYADEQEEMSGTANDLSLLAMALKELEGTLRSNSRVYRPHMVRVTTEILNKCEQIFQSISKHVFVSPHDTRSSEQIEREIRWYFQRHRVKPLQAGIESMRSTLDVLLHVVHLARITKAGEFSVSNANSFLMHPHVQKESAILVGVVLDNRRSIASLKQIEEDRDRRQNLRKKIKDKRKINGTAIDVFLDDGAPKIESNLSTPKSRDSGGSEPFHGWEAGSSAHISTNVGSFPVAAKDSVTNTTYNNTWPFGDIEQHKKGTATSGINPANPGLLDEKDEADEEEKGKADDDSDWAAFITTTKRKHNMKMQRAHHVSKILKSTGVDPILENTQAADDLRSEWGVSSFGENKCKGRKEVEKSNRTSRDNLSDLSIPVKSGSHSKHGGEIDEVPKGGSNGTLTSNEGLECGHPSGSDGLPSASGSQEDSLSQSPASDDSEYYSMSPEFPTKDAREPYMSKNELTMKSDKLETIASAEGSADNPSKSQRSPPKTEMVMPTAQWFLSVVPHESSVSALTERLEANHLRVRAEETAKALLVNWTNVDPDFFFGEESSGGSNSTAYTNCQPHEPLRDEEFSNLPYQTFYSPQIYPAYVPQQWYMPPIITGSSRANEKQTDIEELTRLKKLILDEKAEQDAKEAMAVAAAVPAPIPPILTEKVLEDTAQRTNMKLEAIESMQRLQVHNVQSSAKPPRRPPVVMRDWLGRKFIFPVDMCQTWEGLHTLIREAFGHVLEYKTMVEKGYYNISHITGELILPSTWKLFVQPGLEINMGITKPRQDESGGNPVASGYKVIKDGPKSLTPSHSPEVSPLVPPLGSPKVSPALRSMGEDNASIDDVADNETVYSFPGGTSYTERSDPRYLSIENVLLEQKKSRAEAEMKLERNKRFFQLKQQLLDQGAAIQARQDAAEYAEQDSKLAWLEKQVRDQKEELDRLPPLLITPPGSSAGDSMRKSPTSPQRRASFGARLLERMPSRSPRSKASTRQQMLLERRNSGA